MYFLPGNESRIPVGLAQFLMNRHMAAPPQSGLSGLMPQAAPMAQLPGIGAGMAQAPLRRGTNGGVAVSY